MREVLRAAASGVAMGVAVWTAGCGGGGGSADPAPPPPPVQATVIGRALDSRGAPLPGAAVSVVSGASTLTSLAGRFSLQAEAGARTLRITFGGQLAVERAFTVAGAGTVDLGDLGPAGDLLPWYQDADGDGHGVPGTFLLQHDQPADHAVAFDDCDDADAGVHPGADESCNGKDDDCSGAADDGLTSAFNRDLDGDGFGNPGAQVQSCAPAPGLVADATDCDDADAAVHPGAAERCNGRDDDCSGAADDGLTGAFFQDGDGDGHGDPGAPIATCAPGIRGVASGDDCDDTDPALHPGSAWLDDADGDGYPGTTAAGTGCSPPAPGSILAALNLPADCDDSRAEVGPGNPERHGNGLDDDCDPATADAAPFPLDAMGGRWVLHGLSAGDPALGQWNGWTSGTLVLDPDGHLLSTELRYFDGTSSTAPPFPRIELRPGGALAVDRVAEGMGHLADDARVAVFTSTDPVDGPTLYLPQRPAGGATTADLQGRWAVQQLVAASGSWPATWQRGAWVVDRALGAAEMEVGDGGGFSCALTSTVELDGTVIRSWPHDSHYTLSPDRQLVVGVGSADGGAPLLEVALRTGRAYAQADLAADWVLHLLCAGTPPQPSAWARASVRIDAAGAIAVQSQVASASGLAFPVGTLTVGGEGALRLSSLPTFAGQLSAAKAVLAATFTPDAGGACLVFGLRRRTPPPTVLLDGTGLSALVGAAGGAVEATGADGTRYRLEIPAGALPGGEVEISLRPIAAIERSPLAGPLLGGVQLGPEGLALALPALLTLQLPASLSGPAVGFSWPGSGDDEMRDQNLDASGAAAGRLSLWVQHFSGGGARSGGCSAGCYVSRLAELMRRAALVAAAGGDPGAFDADVRVLLHDWMDQLVIPQTANANDEGSLLRAAGGLLDWETAFQLTQGGDSCAMFGDELDVVADSVQEALTTVIRELDSRCLAETATCARLPWIEKRIYWETQVLLLPNICGTTMSLPALERFCGGGIGTIVRSLRMSPRSRIGQVGGTAGFVAEPWTGLGPLPEGVSPPPYVWESTNPAVALVFSTGPGATASLRAPGDAFIIARTACAEAGANLHVNSRFSGRWQFTWHGKRGYSTRPACDFLLGKTHPAELADLNVYPTQDGAGAELSWTWPLPEVELRGAFAGSAAILRGTMQDEFYTQVAPVARSCAIQLHAASIEGEQPTATGSCTFDFADGLTGFAGCQGTDELKGVRVRAE